MPDRPTAEPRKPPPAKPAQPRYTAAEGELSRWARFLRYQVELWRFCARRLRDNNLMAMSAALSFRTIFAMVPLLVLVFFSLKWTGAVEDRKRSLHSFLSEMGFAQIIAVPEGTFSKEWPGGGEDNEPGFQGEPTQASTSLSSTTPASESAAAPVGADANPTGAPSPTGGSLSVDDALKGGLDNSQLINAADEIERIVESVEDRLSFSRLGPIGALLMLWTAVTLLITVEHSLNRVFSAARNRSLSRRVQMYSTVLVLGPLLVAATSLFADQMMLALANAPGLNWLLALLGWIIGTIGPVIVGVLVLSTIYKVVPNTKVRWSSAVGGAIIAVPLWLVARWGFSLYVRRFVVEGNLYGVLGALPLFLLWLNLSWTIFLFGAELAHTVTNLHRMIRKEQAEQIMLGPSYMLATALIVADHFRRGKGPIDFEDICERLQLPGESVETLVARLQLGRIICAVEHSDASEENNRFTLARLPVDIRVVDVLELGDSDSTADLAPEEAHLINTLHGIRDRRREMFEKQSLEDLAD